MIKPQLAPTKIPTENDIVFPIMVSKKLDGIRCLLANDGCLYSRTEKELPNRGLLERFDKARQWAIENNVILDGELWSPFMSFREIMSAVMSEHKPMPKHLKYWVFDSLSNSRLSHFEPFSFRYNRIQELTQPNVRLVVHETASDWPDIQSRFDKELAAGGEGLILRDPQGRYKHGRCTVREGNIFKLKRFLTIDGQIVDYSRLVIDGSETDAIGSLNVISTLHNGSIVRVSVGSGFDEQTRYKLWKERIKLVGRWIEFKYSTTGTYDKPRFPVFLRFRESK